MRGEEFLFAAEQLLRIPNDEFQSQPTAALWVASANQAIALIADCKKSKALCNQIRQRIREYEDKLKA